LNISYIEYPRSLTTLGGESTLSRVMNRNFLHLAASGAELARLAAFMLLAANMGAIGEAGVFPRLMRYATVPQLLFAAGFFFLWLDRARYGSFRPLLAIGKIASVVALAPLAAEVAFARLEPASRILDLRAAAVQVLILLAVDLGGLALLLLLLPSAAAAPPLPAAPVPSVTAETVDAVMPPADDGAGKVEV